MSLKLSLCSLLLASGAVFGQDQYAFVHFSDNLSSNEFLKSEEILISGTLDDKSKSTWAILDIDQEAKNQLKEKYNTEFVRWNQRLGDVCNLLNQNNALYTAIKYNSHITKFNVQDSPELFRLHDEHIKEISKTGNVVLEGYFDNDDGGFMIMLGTVQKEVILSDKAVENGIIEPEIHSTQLVKRKACNN